MNDQVLAEMLRSLAGAREDEARLFRLMADRIESSTTDERLTISEAAAEMGVSPATVSRLVAEGALKHIDVTGSKRGQRVPRSAIRAFERTRSSQ